MQLCSHLQNFANNIGTLCVIFDINHNTDTILSTCYINNMLCTFIHANMTLAQHLR
jgi:hypothetical protein